MNILNNSTVTTVKSKDIDLASLLRSMEILSELRWSADLWEDSIREIGSRLHASAQTATPTPARSFTLQLQEREKLWAMLESRHSFFGQKPGFRYWLGDGSSIASPIR